MDVNSNELEYHKDKNLRTPSVYYKRYHLNG